MFNLPYFGYPFHNPYYSNFNNMPNNFKDQHQTMKHFENTNTNEFSSHNNEKKEPPSNGASPVFEIFGIKLFLDDLIILGILFFLYQQNVKDEMLYIILFLLLFS